MMTKARVASRVLNVFTAGFELAGGSGVERFVEKISTTLLNLANLSANGRGSVPAL